MGVHHQTPALGGEARAVPDSTAHIKRGRGVRHAGRVQVEHLLKTVHLKIQSSELIWQQLYLFHLSNYHIIKCMNYKRAKALN